jgi:hypothetical protein
MLSGLSALRQTKRSVGSSRRKKLSIRIYKRRRTSSKPTGRFTRTMTGSESSRARCFLPTLCRREMGKSSLRRSVSSSRKNTMRIGNFLWRKTGRF